MTNTTTSYPRPKHGESRHEYFSRALREMGATDRDADYEGMPGRCVEAISETFGRFGHSGQSAAITHWLFNGLMRAYSADVGASDLNPLDDEFTKSFDAMLWAEAFTKYARRTPTIATDIGTMHTWFANAIMRGFDEHGARARNGLIDVIAQLERGDVQPAAVIAALRSLV